MGGGEVVNDAFWNFLGLKILSVSLAHVHTLMHEHTLTHMYTLTHTHTE